MYDFDKVIDRKGTHCAKWDREPNQKDDRLLSLWVADMDFEVLPEIKEALQKRVEHGIFGYSAPWPEYFEAVQQWMDRRHGWQIEPEWIKPVCGVVPALNSIVNIFTEKGDEILIFKPVYYPFDKAIEGNDRKVAAFDLDFDQGKYTIDFDRLDAFLSQRDVKLCIFCSPHNPIGRVWTEEELHKLAEILERHNIMMVSDEIHMDFAYPGHVHIPFLKAAPFMAEKTIVATAPSKTFNLAALSTSNLVIPNQELREKYESKAPALGASTPTILGLTACEAAYRHGDAWVDELKEYLAGNVEFFKTWLAENLPQVTVVEPEGLYLLWVDFRNLGLDEKQLEAFMLQEAHVWLDEGYIFGPAGAGFERFNLACPRSLLKQALEQIKDAWNARQAQTQTKTSI